MLGYLSIFTKITLILLIITSSLYLYSEINNFKYEYIKQRDNILDYKMHVDYTDEERIAQQIEASCLKNKSYTRLFYLNHNITINENKICGKICVYFDSKMKFNKEIKKGKHFITIDCGKGEVYD